MSIPSYHAYNHHYFGWLTGRDSVLSEADTPTLLPNPTTTQFETAPGVEHGYPTNIVFKVTYSFCDTSKIFNLYRKTLVVSFARAIMDTPVDLPSFCIHQVSGWLSPCRLIHIIETTTSLELRATNHGSFQRLSPTT